MAVPGVVMSLVCATTISTTLALGGRRARGMMRLAATAMVSGATRLLALRFGCCNLRIATVAEATEKREWAAVPASSLRFLSLVCTQSTRHLHLVAALLANPLVASESSTPHTEPAMDGRCLVATTSAVFLRGPVDLEHDIYSDMKNSRVGMIVK
jgi:hypothetical protein